MDSSPTPPSLRTRLSLRREERKAGKTSPEAEAAHAYLDAAAVLVEFDPGQIRPARPVEAQVDARAALSDPSELVVSGGVVRWSLNPDARHQALRRLGTVQAMADALAANPDRPSTPEQRIFEQIMTGTWDYVQFTGERLLAAALQASEWLRGVADNIPNPEELRARLDYARFVAPFERLAGEGFVGRTMELQKLHDYVGLEEMRSSKEAVTQVFRGWLLSSKRGPLVVYGPGGVGKSALIARFILDQDSARLAYGGFPIVYIDFDNSNLRLDHPETLVKEAFRQMNLLYPQITELHRTFLQEYERFVARQSDVARGRDRGQSNAPQFNANQFNANEFNPNQSNVLQSNVPASSTSRDYLQAQQFQAAMEFVSEWMAQLAQIRRDLGAPFLILFDTFEEVVTRSRLAIEQVLTLCTRLQEIYPNTRPVVIGRALDTSFGDDLKRAFDTLQVKDFDAEAAQGYLAKFGVSDPEIAQTLFRQLGGSPLTLRLAAEAIARGVTVQKNTGFENLQTRSLMLFAASETVIQGQLYQRILGHIRNPEVPEVRQLASPGLVLRRVTPDIISRVLAEPCKLNLPFYPEQRTIAAQKLFDALRRETFLVDPRGVNSLRHRTDIRRVMLELMENQDRNLVKTIHQAAINYYSKNGITAEDRAEEIYHRLKLGEDPSSVGERWMTGVEDYLGDAIPEVSPRARLFLASRLGVKLKDEEDLYKRAGLQEWELFTIRRVNEAVSSKKPLAEILTVLHERTERSPGSPLYELEAAVLTNNGRYADAAPVLDAGVQSAAACGDRRLLYTLLDALAFTRVNLGQYDVAGELYKRVEDIARDSGDRRLLLSTMINRANFVIRDPQRLHESIPQLAELFLSASDEELRGFKTSMSHILSAPGSAQGPVILRAIDAGVFDDLYTDPWHCLG